MYDNQKGKSEKVNAAVAVPRNEGKGSTRREPKKKKKKKVQRVVVEEESSDDEEDFDAGSDESQFD